MLHGQSETYPNLSCPFRPTVFPELNSVILKALAARLHLCSVLTLCNDYWCTVFSLCLSLSVSLSLSLSLSVCSRSGELRMQKLKSHLVRTQSLNVLPFKPGVGQYIAIHATFSARDFFLVYFYPSSPFTCIFSKTSPSFFLCWLAE